MILILNHENVIVNILETVEYDERNFPKFTVDGMDFCYAVPPHEVFKVAEVPAEVKPIEYCYSEESGFYKNPNYIEPSGYGIPEELVEQIKTDAIAEVEEAVIDGTY